MKLLHIDESEMFLGTGFVVIFDEKPKDRVRGKQGGVVEFHVSDIEELPDGNWQCVVTAKHDDSRGYLDLMIFHEYDSW